MPHVGPMSAAPSHARLLPALLLLTLLAVGVDAQQGRPVSACAPPGQIFSCRNCTGRYVTAPRTSQCGWCGSVSRDSTQGVCLSQAQLDSSPSLCYAYDPLFRVSPNGAAGGGCDPLSSDSPALAIALGVYFGVTLLSSSALAYVVKSRRRGSPSQVACWFAVGVLFSVMAWYMLQCCGPKPRNLSQPQLAQQAAGASLPPELALGSAPPASASVEAAVFYQSFQQQQFPAPPNGSLHLVDARPPPFNPHAFPAPQAAPAYAPELWQGQGRQ